MKPSKSRPTSALYWHPDLTGSWVAWDAEAGALVTFACLAGSWGARRPFVGTVRALRSAPPWGAIGTGWPGFGAVSP